MDIQVTPVSPDHIGFKMPHLQAGFADAADWEHIDDAWEYARAVPPPKITNTSKIFTTVTDMEKTMVAGES